MGFLPLAYALAKPADAELGGQLVRAALAITTRIAEASGRDERDRLLAARGSALECAAALDALRALGSTDAKIAEGHAALFRIVSLLTTKLS
ncbi:MAG: four helix bundle protein [Deltaproteobacteria bacterium]|nr:four helix bundle protein [Deltaproteobacteria bacterium]